MSTATDKYSAWVAVAHSIATEHAMARKDPFLQAMRDYIALPSEKRPIVSPLGILIAEIAALTSLLAVEVCMQKQQAMKDNSPEAYVYFREVESQLQHMAIATRDINLF